MEHLVEITGFWHQFQRSCWFQGNELKHSTDAAHNMLRDLKLADGLADLLTFFEHHFPGATSLADGKDGINELGSPWNHDPAISRVTKKH